MSLGYWKSLISAQAGGTPVTAAARTTLLPTQAQPTIPAGALLDAAGKQILLEAWGQISCAVTTPGTARFDLSFGGTVIFDTLAMNLNIVAKTNVHWCLRALLTQRVVGSVALFLGQGRWESEALIGAPLPTVGGSGFVLVPYNTAPANGATFDSRAAQLVDFAFTQTVATGSCSLTQLNLSCPTNCD